MSPLINPPSEDDELLIEIKHVVQELDQHKYEFIQNFLNVQPWKCNKCGLTNFGRNKRCADWTCKNEH